LEEVKARLPAGITAACHNAADSVTISGELREVETFAAELKAEGIFTRMVDSAGVPFHSPAMQQIRPALETAFRSVVTTNVPRSPKWVSTSIPEHEWDDELAQTSGADYHVNNTMKPVLFYDGCQKIPSNAVVIELAPTGLLQAILRRSIPSNCTAVSLMSKTTSAVTQLEDFFVGLARLHQSGLNLDMSVLYQKVYYPVPPGTPMISPWVKWDHSQDWTVVNVKEHGNRGCGGSATSVTFTYDPHGANSKV